eukprot:2912470-Prorocentrum_lima.AAC.1
MVEGQVLWGTRSRPLEERQRTANMRRTVASLHRSRDASYTGEWDLEPVYRDLQIWLNEKK